MEVLQNQVTNVYDSSDVAWLLMERVQISLFSNLWLCVLLNDKCASVLLCKSIDKLPCISILLNAIHATFIFSSINQLIWRSHLWFWSVTGLSLCNSFAFSWKEVLQSILICWERRRLLFRYLQTLKWSFVENSLEMLQSVLGLLTVQAKRNIRIALQAVNKMIQFIVCKNVNFKFCVTRPLSLWANSFAKWCPEKILEIADNWTSFISNENLPSAVFVVSF